MDSFLSLRPKDALAIIHKGYDPDKAENLSTNSSNKEIHEFIPENVFGKPNAFAVVHSYGAHIDIYQYPPNLENARRNKYGHEKISFTQLALPSTVIISPSFSFVVASPVPTTQGIPISLETIAA